MGDFFKEVFGDNRHPADRTARTRGKRWWQLAKTVRQGLVMGGMYLAMAAGALIVQLAGPGQSVVAGLFAALWLIFGSLSLASAVALRRRQQDVHETRSPPDNGPGATSIARQ
jgi:hypothetical protein